MRIIDLIETWPDSYRKTKILNCFQNKVWDSKGAWFVSAWMLEPNDPKLLLNWDVTMIDQKYYLPMRRLKGIGPTMVDFLLKSVAHVTGNPEPPTRCLHKMKSVVLDERGITKAQCGICGNHFRVAKWKSFKD